MRRKSANAPAGMLSLDELMPSDEELGLMLQDAGNGPEDNFPRAERDYLLQQVVFRIPANLRIVLVLFDMEELTTGPVAQIPRLQQGMVRIRLHWARLSLRKEMNQILRGTSEPGKYSRPASKKSRGNRARRGKRPEGCLDLFANLSEYLDGRAEPLTCDQMHSHIGACPSCVAFLRDLRTAIDRCRALEIPPVNQPLHLDCVPS